MRSPNHIRPNEFVVPVHGGTLKWVVVGMLGLVGVALVAMVLVLAADHSSRRPDPEVGSTTRTTSVQCFPFCGTAPAAPSGPSEPDPIIGSGDR